MDTHAMKERKPRVGGGVGGATRTGSAFRIRRKLQPQPLQCTSRLRLQARDTPRHHHRVSLRLLGQTVPTSAGLRVCVWDIGHLPNWNQSGHTPSKGSSRKEMGEDAAFLLLTESQGLPVAHAVHPWDFLKKTRGKPNSAVICFLGASRRRPPDMYSSPGPKVGLTSAKESITAT